MNKIVKGGIIGLGAWAAIETAFAMGKGYALGALKAAKRDTGIECEEFIDWISRCKLPGRFIAFMANAADEYLSKRHEKEES